MDALKVDSATYAQQLENAMNVNGGDLESATSFDYLMHFCTFWWKVSLNLFSIILLFIIISDSVICLCLSVSFCI